MILIQNLLGFIVSTIPLKDEEYQVELLYNNIWSTVSTVENLRLFVDDGSLERVVLREKKTSSIVETLIVMRMSVILYDKHSKSWTLSYLTGPELEKDQLSVKMWNGSEWLNGDIVNSTETSILIPMRSSIQIQKRASEEDEKQILFHITYKDKQVITCEWALPSITNSQWVLNEIIAPLAATSTVALVTSVLFPNMVKDTKSALTWSIPGWLLIDGVNIFRQVMASSTDTKSLYPVSVKVRDPSFWIKAVATGMGPLLVAAQTSKTNSV